MKKKEIRNKQKLKFDYIKLLQLLGKTWKKNSLLVDKRISRNSEDFNEQVIRIMPDNEKKIFCNTLDKCDDIALYISRVDRSLKDSHKKFSILSEIISKSLKCK
ncbi:MAG: hypothetical protein CMG50_03745 [Candidatus Marinimicrobia bacterium]|nr:hypothetical protein [Candidatus Neomarinimicrobiota bacterium]|tara:strand:- start:19656 stop:19967 length:312 start_codon:yes stop_codon:yes gene_type:complete